jgi:hypothetical protein
MGEFGDLDPAKLSQSVESQRARLQQERAEADRKAAEDARQQAQEQATTLAQAEQGTSELFELLKKAFHGKRMSIDHNLVVEQTGIRPDGTGRVYIDEKPAWIVIKADGQSGNDRHRPLGGLGNPEHVLAARCGLKAKYELLVYPITRQDQPQSLASNDRDAFIKRIQDEVAGR